MKIDIEARGVVQATSTLTHVGARGLDNRGAWPAVERLLRAAVERQFETEGEGRWPPPSPATLRRDRYGNRDPRMMRATGALERALTGRRGPGAERRVGAIEFRYGTTLDYAQYQNRRRPLIPDDDRLQRRLADAVGRNITGGTR